MNLWKLLLLILVINVALGIIVYSDRRGIPWFYKCTPYTVRYAVRESNPFMPVETNSVIILSVKNDYVLVENINKGYPLGMWTPTQSSSKFVMSIKELKYNYPHRKEGTGEPTWWERFLYKRNW